MDADDYQKLAARTLIDAPGFDIPDCDIMIVWNAIGVAGEAGELCDLVKKGIFHQHGLDVAKVRKEIGDCLWYLAGLCTKLGISLSQVMEENNAKLLDRYPDGFDPERSRNRKTGDE